MTDEIGKEESKEETSIKWMNHVTNEVIALLRMYLPISKDALTHIKYTSPVIKRHPGYDELDENKADGVEVMLKFKFDRLIDKPKD